MDSARAKADGAQGMTASGGTLTATIMEIHQKLCERYGNPPHQPDGDPAGSLGEHHLEPEHQ